MYMYQLLMLNLFLTLASASALLLPLSLSLSLSLVFLAVSPLSSGKVLVLYMLYILCSLLLYFSAASAGTRVAVGAGLCIDLKLESTFQ